MYHCIHISTNSLRMLTVHRFFLLLTLFLLLLIVFLAFLMLHALTFVHVLFSIPTIAGCECYGREIIILLILICPLLDFLPWIIYIQPKCERIDLILFKILRHPIKTYKNPSFPFRNDHRHQSFPETKMMQRVMTRQCLIMFKPNREQ